MAVTPDQLCALTPVRAHPNRRNQLFKVGLVCSEMNTIRDPLVTVHWENDPEKPLGLVVLFKCSLENLRTEAEKAIRAFAKELESATIESS
jgi:hypothetical protein